MIASVLLLVGDRATILPRAQAPRFLANQLLPMEVMPDKDHQTNIHTELQASNLDKAQVMGEQAQVILGEQALPMQECQEPAQSTRTLQFKECRSSEAQE